MIIVGEIILFGEEEEEKEGGNNRRRRRDLERSGCGTIIVALISLGLLWQFTRKWEGMKVIKSW